MKSISLGARSSAAAAALCFLGLPSLAQAQRPSVSPLPHQVTVEPEPVVSPGGVSPPDPDGEALEFAPADPDTVLYRKVDEVPVDKKPRRVGNLEYLEHGNAPVYEPLCMGPCKTAVRPGEYELALSPGGETPVPVEDSPTLLSGPSRVRGEYVSHAGQRTLAIGLGVAGAIGGLALMFGANHGGKVDAGMVGGGLGLVGGGVLAVIILWTSDEARVTVEPLPSPAKPVAMADRATWWANHPAQGAALTWRF
ncbi:MAG TPA: hypothetical protein VGI39_20945 [Polyangiaceae bacterium]